MHFFFLESYFTVVYLLYICYNDYMLKGSWKVLAGATLFA